MSVPSKSIDKNKRYAGVKANDFVNKTRTNETSRAAARTPGWANLGKINSRRIPPPANLPSLKSETGTNVPTFDPTIPTGTSHGWTASGGNQTPTNLTTVNQTRPLTPSKQPTQQQLDSLPAHASTPPPSSQASSDMDKPRGATTWSTVTAGSTTANVNDHPPNLLGLNDFPRLVTQESKNTKSSPDSLMSSTTTTTTHGPSFRPANLASWKEGGGRAQPMSTDSLKDSNETNNNNNNNNNPTNLSALSMQSQMLSSSTNTNLLQPQMQNPNNSSYMRMYQQQQPPPPPQSQQMWSYNSYNPYGNNQAPMSTHSSHHQQQRGSSFGHNNQSQNQQRLHSSNDYKSHTILRNKDIDDLSKLTDNVTWASASQEVNYEEKIRFSDDEDNDVVDTTNAKSRRFNNSQQSSRPTYPHVLQNNTRPSQTSTNTTGTRSRLLQDDEHVKQMQDDKNSELISTLTVAKQRRDEQERNLRDTKSQRSTTSAQAPKSFDEQKQIPGYQTRPLLSSTGQENLPSPQTDSNSLWGQSNSSTSTAPVPTTTSRTRHDTADSQTFAMKSWSDQMEFNYASLHEKSNAQVDSNDHDDETAVGGGTSGPVVSRKYSRSHSESSSQSQPDVDTSRTRSKHFPVSTNRKQPGSNVIQPKTSRPKAKTTDSLDYFDNNHEQQQMKSNDQWGAWEDSNFSTNNRYQQSYSNDRRRHQQQSSEDFSQKSHRYPEQKNEYNRPKQSSKTLPNASRTSDVSGSSKSENKPVVNKVQPAWRPLSPTPPLETTDPTPQEAVTLKPQTKTTEINDRRQSAPMERKQRYTSSATPINTSSIPPLMSVRSDVPPTPIPTSVTNSNAGSKHYKTSNQAQRQDYNNASHYSQRNDFYADTSDAAWGNDEDYYDDDTGYYDSNNQTHQRQHQATGYHSHLHHRGYTTLGSYGRYRRSGALRHQQPYATYNTNSTSAASTQLNTSTGSKTKKTLASRALTATNNKKANESSEQPKSVGEVPALMTDEVVRKPSPWTVETKSTTVEEIPIIKSAETPSVPTVVEKTIDSINVPLEQSKEPDSTAIGQSETDTAATTTNKKATGSNAQRKTHKDSQNYHQDQRYQNQQAPRHRNNYAQSMQEYEAMQMAAQNYYGTSRRTARGGRATRLQDLSSGYYYEHPQQRYNNRYNYSTEHYQQQSQTRPSKSTIKRPTSTATDRQQTKSQTANGTNTTTNLRHPSASDNEQKEGEEWETASESSTNMRHAHHETTAQPQTTKPVANDIKSSTRDRTPPKKSFASQRPLVSRYNESRRPYSLHDRGTKSGRGLGHRTGRVSSNVKQLSPSQMNDEENFTAKHMAMMKKDQHRRSLEGYDLNNVAGVVKIETLPAGALEEESTTFDDGGEEFCVVMSKRGRKEQKAAQLFKQNAIETTNVSNEPTSKSVSIDNDEQQPTNEKSSNDPTQTSSTRNRTGKSLPPRFNSKASTSTARQHNAKADPSMYYYDQNYYYYDQNQYYDQEGYYSNYGTYNQSQRQPSTRRKQRTQQQQDTNVTEEHLIERKPEPIVTEKPHPTSSNVMSNIQMWDPQTDNTISNPSRLIEKPSHDRKFGNEIVSSTSASNDTTLPLHQRTATELPTHSPVSKTNETLARTIKPPVTDNKSDREKKTKSASYEKNDTISTIGSNQLFEKSTFLDYDDKQSIGTVGDDYNQKINSLKTIWDISDHPSGQLEQTINTMVAMQQHHHQQDNNVQANNSTKTDGYVKESIPTSSTNSNSNGSSAVNEDSKNKNVSSNVNLQSTGSSSTISQPPTYSTNTVSSKNEQKNICTVKPTQQVPPNIQDQVDVSAYQTFPTPQLPPAMSQASLQQQQQQHMLPQSQVNPLHQTQSYTFYENLLPPQQQPPPPPPPQQQPFNRIYSSTANNTNTDSLNSDFSSLQSSQIYPPQNFSYRNTNVYMQPPPNVPNTNSMYHHTSQGSISAPSQNNTMPPPPPPMANYPSAFLVDPAGHMMSQPQPPPPQAYMNNQMMSGRPQGGPYYRTAPQQQLQTPPGPPYGAQDPLAHAGFYPPFFPTSNSNTPPLGHPSAHNLYGQNEGFHPPPHPQMFARGGSIDRGDHQQLMSQPQPLSRPTSYPSVSSNQQQQPQQQQQQGPPPSLLSQNIKPFHANQQPTSSSNQAPFYPPPNQYGRQPMPIGAMNNTNNRQQTQQVPSLMSGLSKTFPNNGNNLNNNQSLFQHRQPLLPPPQSNNNRPMYQQQQQHQQHHNQYSAYSKPTGPNDDNVKPKHI